MNDHKLLANKKIIAIVRKKYLLKWPYVNLSSVLPNTLLHYLLHIFLFGVHHRVK